MCVCVRGGRAVQYSTSCCLCRCMLASPCSLALCADMELPEELRGSIPQGPVNPFEQVPQKPSRSAFVVDPTALAGKLEQERREKDLLEDEDETEEESSLEYESDISMDRIAPHVSTDEVKVRKDREVFWTSDPQQR